IAGRARERREIQIPVDPQRVAYGILAVGLGVLRRANTAPERRTAGLPVKRDRIIVVRANPMEKNRGLDIERVGGYKEQAGATALGPCRLRILPVDADIVDIACGFAI